ncbi:hypothetical protein FJY68_11365 [candidate division WOR-3 bacterium]|uniref:CARDB domain-containing protein n=1 Tax=candidate division WOR-3 bacterium TaxID=2052148 RepID=A0A938BQS0_UNCW3|nr:hypothetical protein [candidate division WOR-3 bacterium]
MRKILALSLLLVAGASGALTPSSAWSGSYDYDVGLVDYKPFDTILVGDTYTFDRVAVRNYSVVPASVTFHLTLFGPDSVIGYADSRDLVLPVGVTDTVYWLYMPTVFESAGVCLVCCCTLEWSQDQNPANNGGRKHVVVLPRPGVRTAEPADWEPHRAVTSTSTRVLRAGEPGATWYTPAGSRVRAAAARTGVYVVRDDLAVYRVVLLR